MKYWCGYMRWRYNESAMMVLRAFPWAPDDPLEEWMVPGTYHDEFFP